jgi:hypothetical protein
VASEVEETAHEMQALSEGVVVDPQRLEFLGEQFRLGESVGLMPLMKFAHAANSGLDSDDMAGLAALYSLVRDTIHPDDWERFERLAIDKHAEGEEIMAFVGKAIEAISARPTRRRSVSSDGSSSTSPSSTESSSVKPPPAGAAELMSVDELLRRAQVG